MKVKKIMACLCACLFAICLFVIPVSAMYTLISNQSEATNSDFTSMVNSYDWYFGKYVYRTNNVQMQNNGQTPEYIINASDYSLSNMYADFTLVSASANENEMNVYNITMKYNNSASTELSGLYQIEYLPIAQTLKKYNNFYQTNPSFYGKKIRTSGSSTTNYTYNKEVYTSSSSVQNYTTRYYTNIDFTQVNVVGTIPNGYEFITYQLGGTEMHFKYDSTQQKFVYASDFENPEPVLVVGDEECTCDICGHTGLANEEVFTVVNGTTYCDSCYDTAFRDCFNVLCLWNGNK